jgi:hypothetical protein
MYSETKHSSSSFVRINTRRTMTKTEKAVGEVIELNELDELDELFG